MLYLHIPDRDGAPLGVSHFVTPPPGQTMEATAGELCITDCEAALVIVRLGVFAA